MLLDVNVFSTNPSPERSKSRDMLNIGIGKKEKEERNMLLGKNPASADNYDILKNSSNVETFKDEKK